MAALKQVSRAFWEKVFPYEIRCGIEEVPQSPLLPLWRKCSQRTYPDEICADPADSVVNDRATPFSNTPRIGQ